MNLRRPLAAALLALAALPAAASADTAIAELPRATPISAHRGYVAWSDYDATAKTYRLMLKLGTGAATPAAIAPSSKPFDVSLATDEGGIVALYTRCAPRCDIYRYDIAARSETRMRNVSSPREDEAWPVMAGKRLAFVRRRPTGGTREVKSCDVPFVKFLDSKAPSRRLDRGSCASSGALSLRGTRIVQVTVGSPPGRRFVSQVRLLSTRGGRARVLAEQGFGEESNAFASPNQSALDVWVTRSGVSTHGRFVQIDIATGRRSEIPARVELGGALARDERGNFFYVDGDRDLGCSDQELVAVPCRLVQASASPFSDVERVLAPTLTIDAPSNHARVSYGTPFVLSGQLTQTVVRGGALVRIDPVAGVALQILRRRAPDPAQPNRELFEPTAMTATTGADGRWSVAVASPPSKPWFSAVTRGAGVATYAGRGTIGTVDARVSLTVSATTFAGTVVPAQPGRTVTIERLASRQCFKAIVPGVPPACIDQWARVGEAALSAAGTYSTTIAAPAAGTYRASLPAEGETYGGVSAEVQVGG